MHILVTNDDGPPSTHSSPYVLNLVRELQKAGHTVSVCLPHTQRSWIGKAHIIGQTVKPLYYRPPPLPITTLDGDAQQGTIHQRPSPSADVEEWVLVDGTPASCVQIGLYHFFGQDRYKNDQSDGVATVPGAAASSSSGASGSGGSGKILPPIDLVLSGPNYGRNTTAVFALSSGTLGGALEAAICRKRSIALSFAFFTRNHDPLVVSAACKHSVRVVEVLWRQWPEDGSVDLYSVNVPLVEGVEDRPTVWTAMLQNYWDRGGCFMEVEGSIGDEAEEEERIREGIDGEVEGGSAGGGHRHRHFKWAPRFGDVYKSVEMAGPGNDGWTVKEGQTSVTPLKANFCQAAQHLHNKELELKPPVSAQLPEQDKQSREQEHQQQESLAIQAMQYTYRQEDATMEKASKTHLYAIIDYQDPYVQPLIMDALAAVLPPSQVTLVPLSMIWDPTSNSNSNFGRPDYSNSSSEPSLHRAIPVPIPSASSLILQITPYEAIDFEFARSVQQLQHQPSSYLINSYMLRKALIRKHYLASTVANWTAKRPRSILTRHVKVAEHFELDYAEFLDDALVECWDLRASLEKNEYFSATVTADVAGGSKEKADDVGRGQEDGITNHGNRDPNGAQSGPGNDQLQNNYESGIVPPEQREWWILKPSMSDRGQGIKLFSTMQELQGIFDGWEAGVISDGEVGDEDDDDTAKMANGEVLSSLPKVPAARGKYEETQQAIKSCPGGEREAQEADQEGVYDADHDDNITAAHLRHFVAQPYIHPPLLVPGDSRKFHIRTYVLCIGALKVYVYKPMLMLFAAKPYLPPWECGSGGGGIENFLTNTCLQADINKTTLVEYFWSSRLTESQKNGIFGQICDVTGELFEAAAKGMMMHFQPMENAFEVFGVDFLIDSQGTAWLLEVNSFPDFKQTGTDLGWVVAELWKGVLSLVLTPFVSGGSDDLSEERAKEGERPISTAANMTEGEQRNCNLVCIKEVALGRQFPSRGAW